MEIQFGRVKKMLGILLAVCFLLSLTAAAVSDKESPNTAGEKVTKEEKKVKGYSIDIEKATLENDNFRKVLYTAKHSQLVLMSLNPGEEIGTEVHKENDQFLRFEEGQGKCIINGNEYEVNKGSAVIIPAGAQHNIICTSKTDSLKLYTVYSPPVHKDCIVRATKAEAEANPAEFDGMTTELLPVTTAAVGAKEIFNIAGKETEKEEEDEEEEEEEEEEKTENKVKGYCVDIEKATLENNNFRKVLYTAKHNQLVLMSLEPGEEIGLETHKENDQFFRFEEGQGKCIINGNEYKVNKGSAVIIPAGAEHNIICTSKTNSLKIYTVYSPPIHKDCIVRATKAEAEANPAEFDGVTTEQEEE